MVGLSVLTFQICMAPIFLQDHRQPFALCGPQFPQDTCLGQVSPGFASRWPGWCLITNWVSCGLQRHEEGILTAQVMAAEQEGGLVGEPGPLTWSEHAQALGHLPSPKGGLSQWWLEWPFPLLDAAPSALHVGPDLPRMAGVSRAGPELAPCLQ